MPNWCFTEVEIEGPEKEIVYLRNLLVNWMSTESDIPNGFGKTWLGNIARKAGLDWEKVPCRGAIGYFDEKILEGFNGNKAIYFDVETAWIPMHEIWLYLVDTYAPNCEYKYIAEETGCDIWQTNDVSNIGMVCVDCMEGDKKLRDNLVLDEGPNYFTKEKFEEWAKKTFHVKRVMFNDISEKLENYTEDYDNKNGTGSVVHMREVEYVCP